ncbi:MAG TPA: oligosaccharide flippase family protein [Acidimicrobiales bacterium]|nr:oligosaccharide flippase family protein [Acidimicrobiales bacterium]
MTEETLGPLEAESATPAPPPGPLSAQVLRSFANRFGTRILVGGLQLGAFAVLAAHLGPSRAGVYTFAVGFAALFQPLVTFGLRAVALREIAQGRATESQLLPNVLYLRLVVAGLTYLLLWGVVARIGYTPAERSAALVVGLVLVPSALRSFDVAFELRLRLGWVSIADLVESAAFCGGTIALALSHAGTLAFAWLYFGVNLAYVVVVSGAAWPVVRPRWRPQPAAWLPLVKAAAPVGLAGAFVAAYYRIDMAILAALKSQAVVGQYGVAYQLFDAMSVVPGLAAQVVGPVFARSFAAGPQLLADRLGRALRLGCLWLVLTGVGGAMVAWRALPALPGLGRYHGAGVALAVLAPGAGLILLNTMISAALIHAHLQRRLLAVSAMVLVLNVGLDAALIPPFSYVGAAVATVVSEVAVVVASLGLLVRGLGVRLAVPGLGRIALVGVVLAVCLGAGYLVHPFVQLAMGAVAFGVGALAIRAVAWGELAGAITPLKRQAGDPPPIGKN